MVNVEPTPESARSIYAAMERNLEIVRKRIRRPLTLAEKVLYGHLEDAVHQKLEPGKASLLLRPDRVILQDVLGQTAWLQFAQTGRARVAVPTSVHCDHLVTAKVGAGPDLERSLLEDDEVYRFLSRAAARYGAGFWKPGAGIIHQVVLENYAFPGQLIVGTDSHTPNAGGLSACAIGVGGSDAVEVMAGLPWELRHPRRIAIYLEGQTRGWTAPKDVVLAVAGALTVSGGTHAILEYIGPGARTLSATGKATITNMGAEVGATTSMFPADAATLRYLEATGRASLLPVIEEYQALLVPDPEVEQDPERFYDRVLRIDLSSLEPHVVGPHSPDRARPLSQLAREVADPAQSLCDSISSALIGSCTNSSYEDMTRVASVASQAIRAGLRSQASLMVTPGSERVRATIARDGLLEPLEAIGAVVLANACGPCIGQWNRQDPEKGPSTIVTSYNRNFPGRNDGRSSTQSFIASPEIVLALALAGRLSFNPLTDALLNADGEPVYLTPPEPAPDVPAEGFEAGRSFYVAPPDDGSDLDLSLNPASERLMALRPWEGWDGQDFVRLPVLLKTSGKTTTDQISPAGPWLRYRGHLERFSDNLLSGAIDAHTGERGQTMNVFTGERGPVATVARSYREAGVRFVIVGDHNYGEGSSREHAALSPRLLGGAAVIARSFARIHEKNLKSQGLLALTFADPADYDRIGATSRISLGLQDLAEGMPVPCQVHHADGSMSELSLLHSYSEAQLGWFRAGSALNHARASVRSGLQAQR